MMSRLRTLRPDWADRLQAAMRRRFVARGLAMPLASTGLIQARARMRP